MQSILRELWIFIFDCGEDLRHFVRDIYDLAHDDYNCDDYVMACYIALEVTKRIKKPLPVHIHNRLVLGESNEHVVNYINYVSKL